MARAALAGTALLPRTAKADAVVPLNRLITAFRNDRFPPYSKPFAGVLL